MLRMMNKASKADCASLSFDFWQKGFIGLQNHDGGNRRTALPKDGLMVLRIDDGHEDRLC